MIGRADEGFTLMEALVSIAILMVVGSLFAVSFSTGFRAIAKAQDELRTTLTIAQVDRYIRQKTDALHIPYWADSRPYVEGLRDELFRSQFGSHINSVQIINDSRRKPRGILVIFTVKNKRLRTQALFPSVSVMDNLR